MFAAKSKPPPPLFYAARWLRRRLRLLARTDSRKNNTAIPIFFGGCGSNPAHAKNKRARCALYFWRKERDSNPRRLSPQRFSRPPRSTAPPSFRIGRPKGQPFFVVFRRFLALSSAAPLFQSPFPSGARLSESVPKRRPAFGARSSAAPRFQTPFPSAVLNGVRRGRRAPKCPRPSACR